MGELSMKKQLVVALTASVVISGVGTAFAAEDSNQEIKFDGSFSTQYRDQRDTNIVGKPDLNRTAWKTTLTLNVDAPLAKNLDAYASLNYQNINTNAGVGFVADYLHSDDKNNSGISAIGFKYKNDGYSYVVGSQAMTLGGGLAYDNGYIGRNALPYALNVSKKVGATDLNAIVAKTNYQAGIENDKFYAVQGSYAATPETKLGAMFAHVSYGKDTMSNWGFQESSVNFYSVYGSHKLSNKTTISAEYLKASSQADNQAFQTNLSYNLDGKNTLSAGYYHVEDQASIVDYNGGGMTTSPNNNTQGYVVSWKHNFDKNISLKIADLNYTKINATTNVGGANSDRNRFYTTATVSF
jgi:hypothetical protein